MHELSQGRWKVKGLGGSAVLLTTWIDIFFFSFFFGGGGMAPLHSLLNRKQLLLYPNFQIRYYLYILVHQGTSNGSMSKLEVSTHLGCHGIYLVKRVWFQLLYNYFLTSNLTSYHFVAPWATRTHCISFESPNIGTFDLCLVKSVAAFKVCYVGSISTYLHSTYQLV